MRFSTLSSWAMVAACALASPVSLVNRDSSFDFSKDKIKGVNLGGWLLVEPFISPSLFEAFNGSDTPVDEYNYCKTLGKDEAKKRLEKHWQTWITQDDIKHIKEWGFNHVRIPVGYWAFETFDNEPYVSGQLQYLDDALEWASQTGIHAWVDLHGAPGSQNGFDNSGERDALRWQEGDNVEKTLKALQKLVDRYAHNPAVSGIEVLNEPLGPSLDFDKIVDFYEKGYDIIRKKNSDMNVIIHDAFQPNGTFNQYLQPPKYSDVYLDHHHYEMFDNGLLQMNYDEHIDFACEFGRQIQAEKLSPITGEWSAALTDCTKWLNGVGKDTRYEGKLNDSPYVGSCDGINDISTWSDEKKQKTRKFVEAQLEAYEQGGGWFFWTYKTEGALEWDVGKLINNDLFPSPPDNRKNKNICGF